MTDPNQPLITLILQAYEPLDYVTSPTVWMIRQQLERMSANEGWPCKYEACFLNRYDDERESLGWHADDSPEMDPARPIAVISFGGIREIGFRPKGSQKEVKRLALTPGSLMFMHPGMQQSWEHRIPKAGYKAKPRISLTFRGYLRPTPAAKEPVDGPLPPTCPRPSSGDLPTSPPPACLRPRHALRGVPHRSRVGS